MWGGNDKERWKRNSITLILLFWKAWCTACTCKFDLYQNFTWEPAEEDIGYHNLQYTINYEKYLGFKEKDGKQSTFERDTEQIEEIKKHIIYVNDKPTINIDSTTYNIQANHQLVIPLTIKDKNNLTHLDIFGNPDRHNYFSFKKLSKEQFDSIRILIYIIKSYYGESSKTFS